MYECPLKIITLPVASEFDGEVMKIVHRTGINVDHDELAKALQYDRDQYSKGYSDGAKAFVERLKDYLRQQPKWSCRREKYENVGFSYDDVFFGIDKIADEMQIGGEG